MLYHQALPRKSSFQADSIFWVLRTCQESFQLIIFNASPHTPNTPKMRALTIPASYQWGWETSSHLTRVGVCKHWTLTWTCVWIVLVGTATCSSPHCYRVSQHPSSKGKHFTTSCLWEVPKPSGNHLLPWRGRGLMFSVVGEQDPAK